MRNVKYSTYRNPLFLQKLTKKAILGLLTNLCRSYLQTKACMDKKLSYRRETARCFMPTHSRSL